jgi:hypothetical protein
VTRRSAFASASTAGRRRRSSLFPSVSKSISQLGWGPGGGGPPPVGGTRGLRGYPELRRDQPDAAPRTAPDGPTFPCSRPIPRALPGVRLRARY